MTADEDVTAGIAALLDEAEARAQAATAEWNSGWAAQEWQDLPDEVFTHTRLHGPRRVLRQVKAARAVLAEHLPADSIYGLTCKRCVSWQESPGETSEFGLAIPDPWPCLPVASIAAMDADLLGRVAAMLGPGAALEIQDLARKAAG